MRRSVLTSLCIATALVATGTQAYGVWPPSTSFEAERETSPQGTEAVKKPADLHRHVQALMNKLEEDKRRLDAVIQDFKDDEAALKKLSEEI